MKTKLALAAMISSALLLGACSNDSETSAQDSSAQTQVQLPAGIQQATVVQTMAGGGYTYAEVEAGGKKVWLAGPQVQLEPGQQVFWGQAAQMNNFTSKTLGRSFESILFISQFLNAQQIAQLNERQVQSQNIQAAVKTQGKVLKAEEAAGYSYLMVDTGDQHIWLAGPAIPVKTDDQVSWTQGSEMSNFTSKSLGRTFESILFVGSVNVVN